MFLSVTIQFFENEGNREHTSAQYWSRQEINARRRRFSRSGFEQRSAGRVWAYRAVAFTESNESSMVFVIGGSSRDETSSSLKCWRIYEWSLVVSRFKSERKPTGMFGYFRQDVALHPQMPTVTMRWVDRSLPKRMKFSRHCQCRLCLGQGRVCLNLNIQRRPNLKIVDKQGLGVRQVHPVHLFPSKPNLRASLWECLDLFVKTWHCICGCHQMGWVVRLEVWRHCHCRVCLGQGTLKAGKPGRSGFGRKWVASSKFTYAFWWFRTIDLHGVLRLFFSSRLCSCGVGFSNDPWFNEPDRGSLHILWLSIPFVERIGRGCRLKKKSKKRLLVSFCICSF